MSSTTKWLLIASVLALAALPVSAAQAGQQTAPAGKPAAQAGEQAQQPKGQEDWRYTAHNGEWWYWLPANRWVYWRNNRWNDYNPATFTGPASAGAVLTGRVGSSQGTQAAADSDIRPFYGHAISSFDRRTLDESEEVGPFYGHALPNEALAVGAVIAPSVRSTVTPSRPTAIESGGRRQHSIGAGERDWSRKELFPDGPVRLFLIAAAGPSDEYYGRPTSVFVWRHKALAAMEKSRP